MLSKEVSSTIFWIFGLTHPGIEPRFPGPLVNTRLTKTLTTLLKLEKDNKTMIRLPDNDTDFFDIVDGVLQGHILALWLFIYADNLTLPSNAPAQVKTLLHIQYFNQDGIVSSFGLVGREFANGLGDLCSSPSRVIAKTLKMVLDTSFLITEHYKVRIKGKVEQSRERCSALLCVVATAKGVFWSASTTVAKFTFLIIT